MNVCFLMYVLNFFDPTASATAYGRRLKFFRAEHSATAEGENCAYGPTLDPSYLIATVPFDKLQFLNL